MKKLLQTSSVVINSTLIPALNCGLNSLICSVCLGGLLMMVTADTSSEFIEIIFKIGGGVALLTIIISSPFCYLYWKRNSKPLKFDVFDLIKFF